MRIRTALSCILASLLAVTRAEAAAPYLVDVVRPKALLQLDGIEQSVSFLYSYTGVKNGVVSSTAQEIQEKYHFGSAFTILDPSLMQLTMSTDLGFNQSYASEGSSAKGFDWNYMITALALQYDPYPISVTSARTTTQVSTAYLPTYTATTNSNQVWLRLQNKTVPLNLHYSRTSLDSDGLSQVSSTTNDSVTLSATHNYHDRSGTELTTSYNGTSSSVSGASPERSTVYTLTGSNTTSIDRESKYTLGTSFNLGESKQNSIPQTAASFTETFNGIFGKTLQGRAVYQHTYNKTLGYDYKTEQLQQTDALSGTLTHQLFQSLSTNVGANFENQSLTGGSEKDYGAGAGINYQKRLPAKGLFRMGVTSIRNYVDRNSTLSQLIVRDEMHRAPAPGDFVTLTTPGNLGSVTTVKSRSTDPNVGARVYEEGVDYSVNLPLSRIEILAGSTIPTGSEMLITYTLLQNPAVKYYTDTSAVTSSLSLLENRYVISGDYSVQSQHLVSGRADTLSLFDTTMLHLRFDANFVENYLMAEYGNVDSGQSKYWYTNGSWRYVKRFATSDVALNLQDRYTFYDATSSNKENTENEFSLGGSLSRALFNWARISLSANYANTIGENGTGNFAFFRGNLQGRLNQLQFNLTGQTGIRITRGRTNRNDSVLFTVSRYF